MLDKKTLQILEENDIKVYDRTAQGSEFYREIEFFSNAGEDVIETIWYNGTNAGFIRAFIENADNFNPDEHAELWIDGRGRNGVPDTIREILNDADEIKQFLLQIAKKLEEAAQK